MNQRNYNKELEKLMSNKALRGSYLFLHSCCAPCSSAVLERLRAFFRITVFYYNPNISPAAEYEFRKEEQKRLIEELNRAAGAGMGDQTVATTDIATDDLFHIEMVDADYEPTFFYEAVKGLEKEPEGGARCRECFELRLSKTVAEALKQGSDYVTTTLTISPLKNAQLLNEIGEALCEGTNVKWLPSDFKKKDGYKRSIQLSEEFGLYRQNYCGCAFSKAESAMRNGEKETNS